MKAKSRRQRSGQILVIAVLVICLVLLSTQLYIYEVGKSMDGTDSTRVNDFVFAVKLGSRHVIIGSLANISIGGANSALSANLERWASFTGGFYQFGKPVLNFMLTNTSQYTNGTYLSWGTNGFGISSAYTDFNFSLADRQVNVQLSYAVNVTTSLTVEGVYRNVQGDIKKVDVTINSSNEGNLALTKNITVLYDYLGDWFVPDFQNTDYGNGTYLLSFEADIPGTDVNVSVQIYDLREIFVQANATCRDVT